MSIVAAVALFGALIGVCLSAWWRRLRQARLQTQAEAVREAAMVEAEGKILASGAACEAQLTRLRDKRSHHRATQTQHLAEHDAELRQREELSALREEDITRTEADVQEQQVRVDGLEAAQKQAQLLCGPLPQKHRAALSARAACEAAAVVNERVQQWVQSAALEAQIARRQHEQRFEERAGTEAKRLLSLCMDRYSGVGHLERIQNTFMVGKNRGMQRLCNEETPLSKAFVEATGCTLLHDSKAASLSVRADDPLARELGRRVMQALEKARDATVAGVKRDAARAVLQLQQEVDERSREAFRILELPEAHPEVMGLVGRLQFRLSYSQNQWKHAVEVAHLCGMVAAEMGYDVALAKRGGLLHDIGKALTHEREGSHAVIGAEVARRCGEDEIVCNAIGSHHRDEPANSPLAYIVAACDAISGARPGARRDTVTQYLAHIGELQRLVSGLPQVQRVDIMQAGREVRVIVHGAHTEDGQTTQSPAALQDNALFPLAQQIARSIEEELTFAGQIRVTVIRESRAVSMAY